MSALPGDVAAFLAMIEEECAADWLHGDATRLLDKYDVARDKGVLVTAPEPLSPSPEIRYQLRNWHHVTCAGFGGQACTCLAQREALIAELADSLFRSKQ